jgi:hypothetical protein
MIEKGSKTNQKLRKQKAEIENKKSGEHPGEVSLVKQGCTGQKLQGGRKADANSTN